VFSDPNPRLWTRDTRLVDTKQKSHRENVK